MSPRLGRRIAGRSARALAAVAGLLVACSGKITGGDGGAASCTVAAGTYVEHAVSEVDAASCPSLPDQTISINATTTLEAGDGGVPGGGGPGCTSNVDASTCTVSTACTSTTSNVTVATSVTITYASDGSASGKETVTVDDGNGNKTTCTYDISITKA